MLNVKFGRWKNLAQATIDVALGKYGRPPGAVNPELQALACKQSKQEPVTGRPADLLAPRMPQLREELAAKGLPVSDENAVLYAMFPRETEAYYKPKPAAAAPTSPAASATPAAPAPANTALAVGKASRYVLTVNARRYETTVEELN
jgi:oxaloacetate decarboxylase alpha subunit/pyruvate carboxylase subunit B